MSRVHRTLAAIPLLVISVTGCDDPLSPSTMAGVYRLQTVDGDPLPAMIYTTPDATYWVIEELLQLSSKGTGTVQHTREIRHEGGEVSSDSYTMALQYRVSLGRIEITFVCPPNALCVQGPHQIARRTSVGLEVDDLYSQQRLTYVNVVSLP